MRGQGAHFFVIEPAGRCGACGSSWGVMAGCCVICACPTVERQLAMAPQRVKQFGPQLVVQDHGEGGRTSKRWRRSCLSS